MIQLIVTANDDLYERLSIRTQQEGDTPRRATNVLDGFRCAASLSVSKVTIDMAVHASDTLVETLRARSETSHIPVYAIESSDRVPLALRRLCTGVLEESAL